MDNEVFMPSSPRATSPNAPPEPDSDAILDDEAHLRNDPRHANADDLQVDGAARAQRGVTGLETGNNALSLEDYLEFLTHIIQEGYDENDPHKHSRRFISAALVSTDPDTNNPVALDMNKNLYLANDVLDNEDFDVKLTRDTDSIIGIGRTLPYTDALPFYHNPNAFYRLQDNLHMECSLPVQGEVSAHRVRTVPTFG